jgi:hypothetical protein
MKSPGHLGDGDRNIPIAETSRRNMGQTLFRLLARIRKDEGVDPDRYPPVKSDIEYDTRRTMIGSEITARETAALILPAIRSAESISIPNGGRGNRILLLVITLLGIATTTLSWLSLQTAQIDAEAREINMKRNNYLRAAYLGKAVYKEITVDIFPESYTLKFNTDTKGEISITIPHDIPKEEYKSLFKK